MKQRNTGSGKKSWICPLLCKNPLGQKINKTDERSSKAVRGICAVMDTLQHHMEKQIQPRVTIKSRPPYACELLRMVTWLWHSKAVFKQVLPTHRRPFLWGCRNLGHTTYQRVLIKAALTALKKGSDSHFGPKCCPKMPQERFPCHILGQGASRRP